MIDRIKELLKADAWRPFAIRASGRSIRVPTRQHAWVSPNGRVVVEMSASSLEVIYPENLQGIDVEPWSDHEVC
jgi:hypothetical protein